MAWWGVRRLVLAVEEPWIVKVSARAATPAMSHKPKVKPAITRNDEDKPSGMAALTSRLRG
jgi:hypothetical protein